MGRPDLGLLERDDSLSELTQSLEEAVTGRGSMVLIAGEAGAGKTALVNEFSARVTGRILLLEGACDPLSTPRPLGPLLDILADAGSGIGPVDLGEEPFKLFGSVIDRLKSTIRPIVVVIEDVHWADGGTLDFIRFLGRRVGETKALVLCTYRDDEVGPSHPLRVVLGDLATRGYTKRMRVSPLSVDAVHRLAGGGSQDAVRLHRLTGGNPFFLTEILASGKVLPDTVQDAVLARLSRLPEAARNVVEVVSIAPRSMDLDLASRLSAQGPADVDLATGAGMLIADGSGLRFRHELARTAVEESLPATRRMALHREMLRVLADGTELDLAALAHHAIRADDGRLVVAYAPKAARQASSRGARREAVSLYESALAHRDLLDGDQEAALRVGLGSQLALLDQHELAQTHTEAAITHHRATGNTTALANALILASNRYWANRRTDEARTAADEALRLLAPLGPSPELAAAHYVSGYLWMLHRRHEAAMDDIRIALEMAAATRAERTERQARLIEGTIELVTGDPKRGVDLLEEVSIEASRAADSRTVVLATGMLGSGGGEARCYQVAIDALERSIEVGTRNDEDYTVAYSRAWLARIAFEQGRWDEVVTFAGMVEEGPPGRGSISPVTALGALGRAQVRRGDDAAKQTLTTAVSLGEGGEMQHLWPPLCGLAELAWLQGRGDEIPDILEWVYSEALRSDSAWARGEVGFWMWRAAAIASPPPGAAAPFALHIEGAWQEAAAMWGELGCPYEEALALADGDLEAQLQAVQILDRLGARPMAAWLRSRIRDGGHTGVPRGPRPQTRAHPLGLTARQAEVLRRMTEGLSNAEIADRLFISAKTAEHHVSAIYARLGVSRRAEAIARALDRGLVQHGEPDLGE
ncbi:MAG: ATP-binding protein [Acidimicrobiia bacterium]